MTRIRHDFDFLVSIGLLATMLGVDGVEEAAVYMLAAGHVPPTA